MYQFVDLADTFALVRVHMCLIVCMDMFLAWPIMCGCGAKLRILNCNVNHASYWHMPPVPYVIEDTA